MIKIEKTQIFGWEAAIRGMRNPMNSWVKSDSTFSDGLHIGDADLSLMQALAAAGTDHRKYLRMIPVSCDITAPLYWWKEFDTYKVGTVANSCSTMHKITAKEFSLDDFSHEHLNDGGIDTLHDVVDWLNIERVSFLETGNKSYWWNIIQLLPSSYNQRRTVLMNYEVLSNMYHARKAHKLDEWRELCKWIETLPYSEIITGGVENEKV